MALMISQHQVQVMTWCHHKTSHDLNQYWLNLVIVMPYIVTLKSNELILSWFWINYRLPHSLHCLIIIFNALIPLPAWLSFNNLENKDCFFRFFSTFLFCCKCIYLENNIALTHVDTCIILMDISLLFKEWGVGILRKVQSSYSNLSSLISQSWNITLCSWMKLKITPLALVSS